VAKAPSIMDDWVFLAHILGILWTGFMIEGIRIAATQDPWGAWSPFGLLHGRLFASFLSLEAMRGLHAFLWWFHLTITFTWIAYLPFSKMIHIFMSPLNIFLADLRPAG
jgi:nitrate reductase gamma subunit